jgi:hypothetical protein
MPRKDLQMPREEAVIQPRSHSNEDPEAPEPLDGIYL